MKDAKKFNKEPDLAASRVSTLLCIFVSTATVTMMFLPDRALARVMSICAHSQMSTVYCFFVHRTTNPFLMYTAVDVFGEHIHRYNADDLTLSVDCILRHT